MIRYKVTLEPDDNDTLLVTCRDLPGVVTFGETRDAAIRHAGDAIETWIAGLIADGLPVPRPKVYSRLKQNEALVAISALSTLKIELYWAMQEAKITRAELMRRLKWTRESVDRLFRLDHASRLDQLDAAFHVLGRKIDVSIAKAA
jgi:antitoxin HicB